MTTEQGALSEKLIKSSAVIAFILGLFVIYKSQEITFVNKGWILPLLSTTIYFLWNRILYDNLWIDEPKISYSGFMFIGVLLSLGSLGVHIYMLVLYLTDSPLFT